MTSDELQRVRRLMSEGSSEPYHPKAFVSHATADHPFVEKFAADLRANGVDAWYSGWEIKPGDSIRAKIDEGLEGCEYFIIVLSKNSINRPRVQKELDAATVRNLSGEVRKIIPVKFDDCGDLPPTLGSLCWEDFSNQPYDAALKRVLDSILGVDVRPPLGQPPAKPGHEIPTPLPRRTVTQFPISALATGVFVNQLKGEGFDAAGDVYNGQVGIIVGPKGLDRNRMPHNETGIFFPLWELNYWTNRPVVEERRFHDIVEVRPKDWLFNRPYTERLEGLDAVSQPRSAPEDSEFGLIGPHDVDLILVSFHPKDGRHGMTAKLHNRRITNLANCTLIVRDVRSFDAAKGVFRESWGFKPVRIAKLDCRAGFENELGWLLRIQGDRLEVGDMVNQGVMQWPTGDKSSKQRWRLLFSVVVDGLEEWTPEVELEWVRKTAVLTMNRVER